MMRNLDYVLCGLNSFQISLNSLISYSLTLA